MAMVQLTMPVTSCRSSNLSARSDTVSILAVTAMAATRSWFVVMGVISKLACAMSTFRSFRFFLFFPFPAPSGRFASGSGDGRCRVP